MNVFNKLLLLTAIIAEDQGCRQVEYLSSNKGDVTRMLRRWQKNHHVSTWNIRKVKIEKMKLFNRDFHELMEWEYDDLIYDQGEK